MERAVQRVFSRISELIHPLFWRRGFTYSRDDARADAVAGVTVAVIQVPQAMAFAITAGLPAVYGLYASLFGFIASLWGSSRQLSTGPVAIVSLLTLTSLVSLAEPGTPEFIGLAATLAVLVGVIYLTLSLLRLGFIIQFIPNSVVAGFSASAAAIIVISQIPTLLGLPAQQHDLIIQTAASIIRSLPHISLLTSILGVSALALLLAARRLPHTFPSALFILSGAILCGYAFSLGDHGVSLVGLIPSSLPHFTFPVLGVHSFLILLPKAGVVALVAFVSAHANAKTLARTTKERLDTDQELFGQGLANIVTGFFQGFPITGSFSRSAVNVDAGARTGMSSLVSSAMTFFALLFLTPVFFYLPRAALSAIVILAAVSLIDIKRIRDMYGVSRADGLVAFGTFALAFIMQPEQAILLGMIAALLLFITQTVWGAHVTEMGVDLEWGILRSAIAEEKVHTFPQTAIVRIGTSLYFANTAHITEQIDKILANSATRELKPVTLLVLDMSGVNYIDMTGIETLQEYLERLQSTGVRVATIYLRTSLRTAFEKAPEFPRLRMLHNIKEMRALLPHNSNAVA